MPFVAMRESVREVLPWSTCASMQMLRMWVGLWCRAERVVRFMDGIFAVVRMGGTERMGVEFVGVFTTIGGALSLMLEVIARVLFFRQSQGRRTQPDSCR